MVALPPALSGNVDAVLRQWMQCPTRWMQNLMADDVVIIKMDVVCCDRGCSAHEGVCSYPAVVEVPSSGSLNKNAVPLPGSLCPTRQMQYVMTDDAGPMKVDAVFLQWLQCPWHCPGIWMQW